MSCLPVFPCNTVRVVCISDTHNEDPSDYVPDGDVLVHAGDLTDRGTLQELRAAFEWLKILKHNVKVVIAGNNDRGLDPQNLFFSPEAHDLYTSPEAHSHGIRYLSQETAIIAYYRPSSAHRNDPPELLPLRVYANAFTPFLRAVPESVYPTPAFTYLPAPSREAERTWKSAGPAFEARQQGEYTSLYVSHGPPRGRLDGTAQGAGMGCPVLAETLASAKPMFCVFGHIHYGRGAEITRWGGQITRTSEDHGDDGSIKESNQTRKIELLQSITLDAEGERQNRTPNACETIDATAEPNLVSAGKSTLFVNAAWMTRDKRESSKRNPPLVVLLTLPDNV